MTTRPEILQIVREVVAESLGLVLDRVQPGARLIGELNTSSMDQLGILLALEQRVGVQIQMRHLRTFLEGDIPADAYADDDGVLTPAALTYLRRVMPQLCDIPNEGLLATDLISLLTVSNLADVVVAQIEQAG